MRTRVCDVLGIDVPVVCAPFGPWDEVDLAAAVCEAGGLGSLGTAVRPLPEPAGAMGAVGSTHLGRSPSTTRRDPSTRRHSKQRSRSGRR